MVIGFLNLVSVDAKERSKICKRIFILDRRRNQGRSTVKGRMGHVSTSFRKSKDNFDRFWEHTLKESKELRIEDPKLKRKEKIPKKIANFIHQD